MQHQIPALGEQRLHLFKASRFHSGGQATQASNHPQRLLAICPLPAQVKHRVNARHYPDTVSSKQHAVVDAPGEWLINTLGNQPSEAAFPIRESLQIS